MNGFQLFEPLPTSNKPKGPAYKYCKTVQSIAEILDWKYTSKDFHVESDKCS